MAKDAVILLHELGGAPAVFDPEVQEFEKHNFLVRRPYLDGSKTVDELLEYVLQEYDGLVSSGADPNRISIIGCSLGGFLGAEIAARRNVKLLVLIAPATYRKADRQIPLNDLVQGKKYQALIYWRSRTPTAPLIKPQKGIIISFKRDPIIPNSVIKAYLVEGMDRLVDDGENHIPTPSNLMMAMSAILYMR